MSFLQIFPQAYLHVQQVSELNCNSSPHLTSLAKITETACQRCENQFSQFKFFDPQVSKLFPLYISPSSGLLFISPDEDLLFEVETS